MRGAGFLIGEYRHEHGEKKERAIAEDGDPGERLGIGEATAINLEAEGIGAHYDDEEAKNEETGECGPDAQLPTDEEKQAEGDFGKGQRVRYILHGPRREQLVGIDLQRKKRKRDGDGRAGMHDRKEKLGVACVDKDACKDQPADPDDSAAKIERGGLHHASLILGSAAARAISAQEADRETI